MKEITCCFTGNRPQKLPWGNNENSERCLDFKMNLRCEILKAIEFGYRNFIFGMALGVDIMAFEECLALKVLYPISLECALPCKYQDIMWCVKDRDRYARLVKQADKVTIVSQFYTEDCMKVRNQYMIDKSSMLIAVINKKFGGAHQTAQIAELSNLNVVYMLP